MSQERPPEGTAARIATRAIDRRRRLFDDVIENEVPLTDPEGLYEACRYLIDAGGKRLRPTVLFLAAESLAGIDASVSNYRAVPAVDGSAVDVLKAAASVEVFHTYTLIHDDIMDEDDLRRGVPSVHTEYDLSTAILAGDTLYSTAFELLLEAGAQPDRAVRAQSELASTCTRICEGQSLDIAFESRGAVDVEEYLTMVRQKTAMLYETAVSLPPILLGHDDAVAPLASYGRNVGTAFQIQDDLLDLTAPSEKLGKQRGSDLVEGKETLITVHAREQGVDVDGLIDAESETALAESEVEAAVAELEAAGSLDYARRTAEELIAEGKAHLAVLPDGRPRRSLLAIADFLIEREY